MVHIFELTYSIRSDNRIITFNQTNIFPRNQNICVPLVDFVTLWMHGFNWYKHHLHYLSN